VAAGAVVAAGQQQHGEKEDHDEGDDSENLHPARCAGGWLVVGFYAGDGLARWVRHAPLSSRVVANVFSQQFTRHYVYVKS